MYSICLLHTSFTTIKISCELWAICWIAKIQPLLQVIFSYTLRSMIKARMRFLPASAAICLLGTENNRAVEPANFFFGSGPGSSFFFSWLLLQLIFFQVALAPHFFSTGSGTLFFFQPAPAPHFFSTSSSSGSSFFSTGSGSRSSLGGSGMSVWVVCK